MDCAHEDDSDLLRTGSRSQHGRLRVVARDETVWEGSLPSLTSPSTTPTCGFPLRSTSPSSRLECPGYDIPAGFQVFKRLESSKLSDSTIVACSIFGTAYFDLQGIGESL